MASAERVRPRAPEGVVTRRWIWERWHDDRFVPGAALEDDVFVRFAGTVMLAARFWGDGSGAWRFDGANGGPWRPEAPWLDVTGPVLATSGARRRAPEPDSWQQLQLPFPGDAFATAWNQRAEALPRALARVPAPVRRELARVEPASQWALLRWLDAAGAHGTELAASNLALALLLVRHGERHGLRPDVVGWRRREIVGALGLPARDASVRVLAKVRAPRLGPALVAHVARWLRDPALLARLGHLPRIGPAAACFEHPSELAAFSETALAELLADPNDTHRETLGRYLALRRHLVRGGYPVPDTIRSLVRFDAAADALDARIAGHDRLPAAKRLAPPPLADAPGGIEALRSVGDIDAEARRMRHCVRDATRDAVRGRLALYRVLRPERATLQIEPTGPGGRWQIVQLKCFANRTPHRATVRAVEGWLELRQRGR